MVCRKMVMGITDRGTIGKQHNKAQRKKGKPKRGRKKGSELRWVSDRSSGRKGGQTVVVGGELIVKKRMFRAK